jgi:hypothetical protein
MSILSSASGSLIAIWRASSKADLTPLPQIILGDFATLEDLFAWSASYLRGVGPLTAQCRVLTPDMFRQALRPRLEAAWGTLAGGAVGSVFGEVLMHTRGTMPISRITQAACRGTLSFALMRATAVGVPLHELPHVGTIWDEIRGQTGQAPTIVPSGEISEAVLSLVAAKLNERSADRGKLEEWFVAFLSKDGTGNLLHQIRKSFGPLPNDLVLDNFNQLTAEARVKALDELAPVFLSHSDRTRSEKAFATALVAYLCRAGLPQQVSLLAPFTEALPQSMVWLGVMQAANAFTDTLAQGEGLGWRIARDLFEPPDIFAPPSADISFLELTALSRGRAGARMISALGKTRLDVELMPNVSSYVRTPHLDIADQPSLPLASPTSAAEPRTDTVPRQISDEMLSEAETALEVLSRLLRTARFRSPGDRPTVRRRRK